MKISEYIQWMRDEYGVELSEEELKAEGFTDNKKPPADWHPKAAG